MGILLRGIYCPARPATPTGLEERQTACRYENCLGLFFFLVTSQFTWHFMAIIKFTCFNTKGTCFLPVLVLQQLLLRFAAVVAAAAAAAYFLSLLHRCTSCLIRVRTRLPRFLPLSFFAANDLGLGLPLLLPLLENAREEVLFRAAPCPGVGILSGLERSLGMGGGGCSIYWREMRQPLLRSAVEMDAQIDKLLVLRFTS